MSHAKRFSCIYHAFSAGGEGGWRPSPAPPPGMFRAVAIRFGMGKLSQEALVRPLYRFAFAGVAAAVLAATGCSSSSSSGSSGSSVNWANETSVSAGGGMSALAAAAKKEGTLNVIALPPTWANYGTIINTFEKKYGITVNSTLPDGTSQHQAVRAVRGQHLV